MTRTRAARGVGIAVVLGLLGLLVVFPVVELARVALERGWSGVTSTLSASGTTRAIEHTVLVSGAVTLLAVGGGTAAALAIERRPLRTRRLLRIAVLAPLLIPEFVLGFGWSQAYGPAGLLDRLIGLRIPGLLGPFGVILVLAIHTMPLAYLAVAAGLAVRSEPELEYAARGSGAGALTVLRTITLPLLRLPLLAAAALVLVATANSFAVPQVLGTPAGFGTMPTLVYQDLNLSADPNAFDELAVVALALAVLVFVAVGLLDLALGAMPAHLARTSLPTGSAGSGRGGVLTSVTIGIYTLIAAVVPLLVLLAAAVTRGPGLSPTPSNWTLHNFSDAFAGPTWVALSHTLLLAAIAAAAIPVMSLLVVAAGRRTRAALGTAVIVAFAVPGSALAVGVLIAYGKALSGSAVMILIAYLAKLWALGHRPISAGVDRLVPEHAMAARAAGAGLESAFRTVVLPPLRIALLTAAALVFLFAVQELTMSSILYGPGSETFAAVVLNQQDLGAVGATAALAVTLVLPLLAIGALLVYARRLHNRAFGVSAG